MIWGYHHHKWRWFSSRPAMFASRCSLQLSFNQSTWCQLIRPLHYQCGWLIPVPSSPTKYCFHCLFPFKHVVLPQPLHFTGCTNRIKLATFSWKHLVKWQSETLHSKSARKILGKKKQTNLSSYGWLANPTSTAGRSWERCHSCVCNWRPESGLVQL